MRISVDIGGTFTDVVCIDDRGELHIRKALSTPADQSLGVIDGYEFDTVRPQAWRYRDYVVRSFNADKPYDRFIREQIAGDQLGRDAARHPGRAWWGTAPGHRQSPASPAPAS